MGNLERLVAICDRLEIDIPADDPESVILDIFENILDRLDDLEYEEIDNIDL